MGGVLDDALALPHGAAGASLFSEGTLPAMEPRQRMDEALSPYCSPTELREKLRRGDAFLLLDVRTPEEWAIARIEGARLIPMDLIRNALGELEEHLDDEIVVMCHHGVRSANVQGYLLTQGFTKVRNLVGGIDRYSSDADPTVPRY